MPSPEPEAPADVLPEPAPVSSIPAGPACAACDARALVHWQRRLTPAELAHHIRVEQERRDDRLLLADPQLPAPQFGPLPCAEDTTRIVLACGPHAITMDAAAFIHEATCTAPNEADLPGCDCTPEPHPQAGSDEPEAAPALPAHWMPGGA